MNDHTNPRIYVSHNLNDALDSIDDQLDAYEMRGRTGPEPTVDCDFFGKRRICHSVSEICDFHTLALRKANRRAEELACLSKPNGKNNPSSVRAPASTALPRIIDPACIARGRSSWASAILWSVAAAILFAIAVALYFSLTGCAGGNLFLAGTRHDTFPGDIEIRSTNTLGDPSLTTYVRDEDASHTRTTVISGTGVASLPFQVLDPIAHGAGRFILDRGADNAFWAQLLEEAADYYKAQARSGTPDPAPERP